MSVNNRDNRLFRHMKDTTNQKAPKVQRGQFAGSKGGLISCRFQGCSDWLRASLKPKLSVRNLLPLSGFLAGHRI